MAALLAWPFLFVWPYVVSVAGRYVHIGNDFGPLYYTYKPFLLEGLITTGIPRWCPSEGSGFPFESNPFTQSHYPLNTLLTLCYRLHGGWSRLDHQRYTVAALALFGLGCFLWLKRLRLDARAALWASLVTSVSYKWTEVLRFPNAAHAACWYPWALWSITGLFQATSPLSLAAHSVALGAFLYAIATAGYPYYLVYAAFLLGPYALALAVQRGRESRLRWPWTLLALAVTGTAVLRAILPYLLEVQQTLSQAYNRAGGNTAFAAQYANDALDLLGSFVYPPIAQAEGWFFFSVTGLLLIAAAIPLLPRDRKRAATAVGAWAVAVLLMTCAPTWPLAAPVIGGLPVLSAMRAWSRLTIILTPAIAWFLAVSVEALLTRESSQDRDAALRRRLQRGWSVVAAIQLVLLATRTTHGYWREVFVPKLAEGLAKNPARIQLFFELTVLAGSAVAAAALWWCFRRREAGATLPRPAKVLTVLFAAASIELGMMGPWIWIARPAAVEPRFRYPVQEWHQRSLSTPRARINQTTPAGPAYSVGIIPSWFYDRYIRFLAYAARTQPAAAVDTLLGLRDGRRLYFTPDVHYSSFSTFLKDAQRSQARFHDLAYTGDRLSFRVETPGSGYVSFIDNWDPRWLAWVDGQQTRVDLLFGTFKAVKVSRGSHLVQMTFETP